MINIEDQWVKDMQQAFSDVNVNDIDSLSTSMGLEGDKISEETPLWPNDLENVYRSMQRVYKNREEYDLL